MTERRERIPADEVKESKRWNLPFWTEPDHLVHSDEPTEDVIVEDEELELEPLTAEQLEVIRQDAFNEGLEQGLIEGRQKGEKLGYEDGHQTGLKQGQEEGRKLGFDSGFAEGESKAIEKGNQQNETNNQTLQTLLNEIQQQLAQQKQTLADHIPDIVLSLAKAVVSQELAQGSEHIIALVQQALDALPLDSGELKIEVSPDDLPFIEAAIEQGEFDGVAHSNDEIKAGGCRVHTRYSAVDFTLSERWASIEKQYQRQVQLALNNDDAYSEDDDTVDEPSETVSSALEENSKEDAPSNHMDETDVDGNKEHPQTPPHEQNTSPETNDDEMNINEINEQGSDTTQTKDSQPHTPDDPDES